jgi:indole-3-glycerol phosphate synthase
MSTHLDKIVATTRATVAASREQTPLAEQESLAAQHSPRGWAAALRAAGKTGPAIIAELKKASPSKGLIRAEFDVPWLAQRYAAGGAAVLSVLTDEPYFQGSLRNLELASEAVLLPCLRKDFTVDEYQIVEARAHGGDAILLIVAVLTDDELLRFTRAAHALDLDVLCEVHTEGELDRALSIAEPPDALGVNNRDLRTFEVRLETSLELVDRIPGSMIRVAESGIATAADLNRLRAAGFDAFLIGESLMRQPDPAIALQALLAKVALPEQIAAGVKVLNPFEIRNAGSATP